MELVQLGSSCRVLATLYWGGEVAVDSESFPNASLYFFSKLDKLAMFEYGYLHGMPWTLGV